MSTNGRLSSIRKPRRESAGSMMDQFDRYVVHPHSIAQDITGGGQESVDDTSQLHYDRDDSRMSIDSSPPDIRHRP